MTHGTTSAPPVPSNPPRASRRVHRTALIGAASGLLLLGLVPATALAGPVAVVPVHSATVPTTTVGTRQPVTGVSALTAASLVPSPARAYQDKPAVYSTVRDETGRFKTCHAMKATTRPVPCVFGDPKGKVRVLVVGDSHLAQWYSPLRAAADAAGWQLLWFTKTACPAQDVSVRVWRTTARYPECDTWRRNVLKAVAGTSSKWDLILVSGYRDHALVSRSTGGSLRGTAAVREWKIGLTRTLKVLSPKASKVVVLRDTPRQRVDVPKCLTSHPTKLNACTTARSWALPTAYWTVERAAAAALPNGGTLDFADVVCPTSTCPITSGRILMWRDDTHLTRTYSRTLAPIVRTRIAAFL